MSIRRSNIWNMSHDDSAASSQSLERGLAILATFTPDRPALGISELAERLGLTRSTTHRYVATLARLGFTSARTSRRASDRLSGIRALRPGISPCSASLELRDPWIARAAPATPHRETHGAHLEAVMPSAMIIATSS